MATRGNPARRVPGNPLAGVLHEIQRSSRTARRTSLSPVWSGTAEADETGRASVSFTAAFTATPVISVSVLSTAPYLATVTSASATGAVIAVWNPDGTSAPGGVTVHVTARERTPAP